MSGSKQGKAALFDLALRSEPCVGELAMAWPLERRAELRKELEAGRLHELEFEAVVFLARYPNKNHIRFRDEDLAPFAASFGGVPFLRNHNAGDIGARDGTVVASRLDGDCIVQTVRLSTHRGIEDFLNRVIDRFSISWFVEEVRCSVCGEDWMGSKCSHWPGEKVTVDGRQQVVELVFLKPRAKEVSAVNVPAVDGTYVLSQLCECKEIRGRMEKVTEGILSHEEGESASAGGRDFAGEMPAAILPVSQVQAVAPPVAEVDVATVAAQLDALQAQLAQERIEQLIAASGLSAEGLEVVRQASGGVDPADRWPAERVAGLIEAQRKVEAGLLARQLVQGIEPLNTGRIQGMRTPADELQDAVTWLMGDPMVKTPVPSLRNLREVYLALTGDIGFYGRFDPEHAQLAAASTTTLAGMAVNALNKVILYHYDNLATYRWYEQVVSVVPHDGSTQDVQLIMLDGVAALSTVGEGGAYTELPVGDSRETMAFAKRGNYVGITLEMFRKSEIARLQAIPRVLMQSAIRTRSAAIAGLFTQASGAGPTLADDTTALFHANHGNLDTTAFGDVAWAAARKRIFSQTVPGTGKKLGLWPTYCLVPIDLYDPALAAFGYGAGDVGKPNTGGTAQTVNPYGQSRAGDPRPIPVVVPEWTDATDWAYLVDPRLHPVLCMAYANQPQGNGHALPEFFTASNENQGLLFTNDTLPIKVRDWWGYGAATYVGVGKNNVAG